MLVDKLDLLVPLEQDAEIVKTSHEALQPHPVREKDRQRRPGLPDPLQEGILEIPSALRGHIAFPKHTPMRRC